MVIYGLQEGHADILVDQDGQRQFAQTISFNEDEEVSVTYFYIV